MIVRAPAIIAFFVLSSASFAGEIREFDLKTIERLGKELARVSQTRDRGATDAVRKRAKETGMTAAKSKLFKARYDYVVLDDPDESGFLVYALALSKTPSEIVMGGHIRVTVSADGSKAERVDALSHTLLTNPPPPKGMEGKKPITVSMSQVVSDKPVETCVYISLLHKVIVGVGTMDGKVWTVISDKIFEMTPELMKSLAEDEKKEKKK